MRARVARGMSPAAAKRKCGSASVAKLVDPAKTELKVPIAAFPQKVFALPAGKDSPKVSKCFQSDLPCPDL